MHYFPKYCIRVSLTLMKLHLVLHVVANLGKYIVALCPGRLPPHDSLFYPILPSFRDRGQEIKARDARAVRCPSLAKDELCE